MVNIKEASRVLDEFQAWLGQTRTQEVNDVVSGSRIDLGEVGGGKLVYTLVRYQRRNASDPDQPRILLWTTQPTLALVHAENLQNGSGRRREVITAIPYGKDLINLPGNLGHSVLEHLDRRRSAVAAAR